MNHNYSKFHFENVGDEDLEKSEYLENRKNFWDEIKRFFQNFLKAFCQPHIKNST